MKKLFFLTTSASLLSAVLWAQTPVADAPQDAQDLKAASQAPGAPLVPPEIKTLVDTFVTALNKGDDAAVSACWHSPKVLAKAPQEGAAAGESPLVQNPDQQTQFNANDANLASARAKQIRTFLGQRFFGRPFEVKLLRVEVSRGAAATTASENTYDDVKLHCLVSGTTQVMLSIDDVVKINGAWKFRGPLKDQVTILMPAMP